MILSENILVLLNRQVETETGSVGEQPVRDKFDLYKL
jgi:hypothetical protein